MKLPSAFQKVHALQKVQTQNHGLSRENTIPNSDVFQCKNSANCKAFNAPYFAC